MSEAIPLHRSTRRLAAIAFLDVVEYSRLMGVSEDGTLRNWSDLRAQIIEPRITYWRGRIASRIGDGIFVEFGSALDALQWAVDVQRVVNRPDIGGDQIRLRIALHLADVIDEPDGEVMGDGVNVAARLQAFAHPGGIIASQSLVDAVAGKTDAEFSNLGQLHLKNIARPVHAYRLQLRARPRARHLRCWAPRIAAPVIALATLAAILLSPALNLRADPHRQAERFLQQGLDLQCEASPCPRTWLAKRAFYEKAIAADPAFARPYAEAALTYTYFVSTNTSVDPQEDLREAARLATHAVALAPDQGYAYAARAAVLRQNPDKIESALFDYTRAISLDPALVMARANAGWMLILLGRTAEAPPYLQAALDAAPNHVFAPAWLTYLGLADLFLDRPGHGAEFFRRALAMQPPGPVGWQHRVERTIALASAEALDGDLEDARKIIRLLRLEHPTLSTNNILWNCDCSRNPVFLAGVGKLRQGAALAGVPEAGWVTGSASQPPLLQSK